MTQHEQRIHDALAHQADGYAYTPFSITDIERTVGRQQRHRLRRTASVLGAAAAVTVLAVSGALVANNGADRSTQTADTPDATDEAQPFPGPPAGSKWVGMNGVVVAVPSNWPVTDSECGSGESEEVVFAQRMGDCRPTGTVAQLLISATYSDKSTPRKVSCSGPSELPYCIGVLRFAEPGVLVRFLTHSEDGRARIERLLDSAMVLPDGWTTVPVGGEGGPESRTAVLEEAGFNVESERLPTVDSPVLSDPESGSPVREGATITLYRAPQEQNPEAQELTVDVKATGLSTTDPQQAKDSARWDAERWALIYVPKTFYSTCLPEGRAMKAGRSVDLSLTVAADAACRNIMQSARVTISGLTEAPTELKVTEDGETRTLPVEQEQSGYLPDEDYIPIADMVIQEAKAAGLPTPLEVDRDKNGGLIVRLKRADLARFSQAELVDGFSRLSGLAVTVEQGEPYEGGPGLAPG